MSFTITDPIIDDWFLMSSPLPVLSIAACYLLFVLQYGPRWMDTRKPFVLKNTLIVYNAAQVLFSTMLCVQPFFIGGINRALYVTCNANASVDRDLQLTVSEAPSTPQVVIE